MSIPDSDMPLLTIQELRTAEAPKLYQPHTVAKPKAFDWDALTPTCSQCATQTGQVSTVTGLCPGCDPERPAEAAERPAVVRPKTTRTRIQFDTDAAVEAYEGGQRVSEIAKALDVQPYRIRNLLVYRGIELRDDRARRWSDIPRAPRKPRAAGGRTPNTRTPIDESALVADYLTGQTSPELALKYGITPKRVRDTVGRHGHELRDDRKTRSGGKPKTYDPALVEQIRGLYLTERLSQSVIAQQLGTSTKVVQTIMVRHQIPARQGETGRMDGAAPLKAAITEYGVPIHDIKTWALHQGLLFAIAPGIPPRRIFDAYVDAHQDGAA